MVVRANVLRIGNVLMQRAHIKRNCCEHFDYYLQDALGRHGEKIVIEKYIIILLR
jgi:hypothetical protein